MSASAQIKIECVDKLGILVTTPKRIKIILGGRGSTKSTFAADNVIAKVAQGQVWCCAREYQNTIDDSVHALLQNEVKRTKIPGFDISLKNEIKHLSGGRTFYRGLARNVTGIKSIVCDGLWVEEGETLSEATLRILTASIRASALDVQEALENEYEIEAPEIWITLNRGSRNDPISKKFLERAEPALAETGVYEDDLMIIVEVNYDEVPQDWFRMSGLEQERVDDLSNMSEEEYAHKWDGKYLDTVEGAIILEKWFDAAIDAHKKLDAIKPRGARIATFDPADSGDDKAVGIRHGSVVEDIKATGLGDINDACDWATDYAIAHNADTFSWDWIGVGVGLTRDINKAFEGKKTTVKPFVASESPDNPNDYVNGKDGKKNKDYFKNKRAQNFHRLAERFQNTYRAIVKKEYIDPDEMISISSNIKDLYQLRAEVCRIPRIKNNNGFYQIMSKKDMKRIYNIDSPNMADVLMMMMEQPEQNTLDFDLDFISLSNR